MLHLDQIRSRRIFTVPYRWGMIDQTFTSTGEAQELAEAFPDEGFLYRRLLDGRYLRRPLVEFGRREPHNARSLPSLYTGLVEEILSDGYRQALSEATGLDLGESKIEASMWRYDHGTIFAVHDDAPVVYLSHVIYLNPTWDARWGGRLQILRSENDDDVVFELLPQLGVSTLIVRADDSWHRITPVSQSAPESRNTITVQFHRPGSPGPREYR